MDSRHAFVVLALALVLAPGLASSASRVLIYRAAGSFSVAGGFGGGSVFAHPFDDVVVTATCEPSGVFLVRATPGAGYAPFVGATGLPAATATCMAPGTVSTDPFHMDAGAWMFEMQGLAGVADLEGTLTVTGIRAD